ncbi:ABC-type sugar transport system, substrate-binding protein, contains N-terminal xre family HTH domain [Sporobacter termitidis DSM 10068]|uniref:ABC-type sugar transport system, substrate-binding protein, contains N-terminal xre family HTH domain n=1 Tax=Sporobacter termitidis DSM 10068 TaxID=1123282 RepID=A0A1M5XJP6_9FIRM|nr:substrate-binding domain-containing protein [Sporobacter termitidis]SHI00095.1 ABC-type sugar transport system, substrate-binding protein, contains N-terminal xre family HTH domain [Sporobacter termitidis DSM 10068]
MKKVLAVLLAAAMAFTLFACASGTATTSPSPSPSASAVPSASANAGTAPSSTAVTTAEEKWEPGFYNHTMDYSKNPRYKVVYMMSQNSGLFDTFTWAFGEWSKLENCDFSTFNSNGDNDLFVTTLQTMADQGVDGYILDPDSTIYPRIVEVMNELKIPFMTGMGAAFDENGKLLHPTAGFDNYKFGVDETEWAIDYAKKNWLEAKDDDIGIIALDYSVVPQIHSRTEAAKDIWLKYYPGQEAHFFVGDGVTSGLMNADGGFNLTAPIMSSNTNIKYWIVAAAFDDYADGAARAAEQAGIDKNTVVICPGGAELVAHWEAGESSCWKAVVYSGDGLFSEPIFNGLYAQMHGDATAETLWPEWVDHSKGEKYANLIVPTIVLTQDTYKQFIAWEEHYTGIARYNFTWDGTTTFPGRAEVPASYAG